MRLKTFSKAMLGFVILKVSLLILSHSTHPGKKLDQLEPEIMSLHSYSIERAAGVIRRLHLSDQSFPFLPIIDTKIPIATKSMPSG